MRTPFRLRCAWGQPRDSRARRTKSRTWRYSRVAKYLGRPPFQAETPFDTTTYTMGNIASEVELSGRLVARCHHGLPSHSALGPRVGRYSSRRWVFISRNANSAIAKFLLLSRLRSPLKGCIQKAPPPPSQCGEEEKPNQRQETYRHQTKWGRYQTAAQ